MIRIPTFEELIKRIRQPKVKDLEEFDADQASEFGYKLPTGWKLKRLEGVDSLMSPRGLTFTDLKIDGGKITDFQVFKGDKPVRLPKLGERITPPVQLVEPPPMEPPPVEPPPTETPILPEMEKRRLVALAAQIMRQTRKPESLLRSTRGMALRDFESLMGMSFQEYSILEPKPGELREALGEKLGEYIEQFLADGDYRVRIAGEPKGFIERWEEAGEAVIATTGAPLFEVAGVPISAHDIAFVVLAAMGIYQVGNTGWNMLLDRVLKKPGDLNFLGKQLTKAGLNRNLNIVERQYKIKIPTETRNNFINRYLNDMAAAWERNIAGQGKAVNIQSLQIASQNTYAQTASVVQREIQALVPRATQTGAMAMGGIVEPTIASVVAKIISNQALNLAERQLYTNQAQAVEDALKAQVTPEVTPTPEVPAVPEAVRSLPLEGISKLETRVPLGLIRKDESVEIARLTKEIQEEGITEPITIRVREDGSQIVWDGLHRLIVAQDLGIKNIPVQFIGDEGVAIKKPPTIPKSPIEVAKLAEQLKAKLEAKPVTKPPTPKLPVERRAEIQSLLKEPAKNLPKGITKIGLRKELSEINKSLIPQEKKLRSQIMATVKSKSLGVTQYRGIFKDTGGSRYLTNQELTQLEKVLKAIQRARPKRIRGKIVITPKREALIQSSKKDLVDQGILTEATYKDILKSLKLSTDKYVDSQNFITNSQGSDIIRNMRNMAILNPLGELTFKKPSAIKYLTSQIYYSQILGLKPLTEPLELAKIDFDLAYRAMSRAIDNKLHKVNKLWKTKKGETLRDLLDKNEEAPAELTDKQRELFNWFRNLNRSIINGENEVRRAMGVEEITYRQAYVRHIPDAMAWDIINGTHPLPPSLQYWSKKLVSKKIFNPMELHRQLSGDLADLYSKDLAYASKDMVYTGLKEIHLAQPLRAFTERMGALSDLMPAETRRWVTDYVNQVIKGQQTEFDASINAIVTESGIGGVIDKVLRPLGLSLGQRLVTRLTTTIGRGTIFAVLGLPRPRLARLMIRNLFQRTQELALHGITPTLKSFLPDSKALKEIKGESRYLKSYTGVEEWPADMMGKLAKIPLAPYQATAVLNADRGMSVAYRDYLKFITNKKYKGLVGRTGKRWASPKRTYEEPEGFLYPEEQKLLLSEMELATRAAQYQYIGMGMPEIFRHKTLIPITRLQSWWMNYFSMFLREGFHRFAYGETMSGYPLPWSSRVNWLKYLLLGGAILTSMGYSASYLVKVLPHNESPVAEFAIGLAKYVSATSDWQRAQAKRDMQYAWKAIVPGPMAIDEIRKLWSGEMPLWQMFFYGREEEGPPPHIPDWGFPIKESALSVAQTEITQGISSLGKFDQAELDAKVEEATEAGASLARIREIKAEDYLYDITSLRRDIGDATRGLEEKDIDKLEPIASNYVEFKAQKADYDLLSDEQQERYIKRNPKYTTNRLFWGELITIPFIDIAEALEAQAKKYNIPLDMIPAFQLTDKGRERIPLNRELWEAYFTYYDLPGSGGYLSLSQSAVDDGRLPDEYRQIWEDYQKLKTDIAKSAYRKRYRNLTVNLRNEFRRANPEFSKWAEELSNMGDGGEGLNPLPKKAISRTAKGRMTLPSGGFVTGGVRPRRAKVTYPKFKKPKISMGIRAPRVPSP